MPKFESMIKNYLLGSLGNFKECYLLLNPADKDDFLIYASNSELLDADNKLSMYEGFNLILG